MSGYKRQLPTSDLDMEMMLTDPDWGTPTLSTDLNEKLNKILSETDDETVTENLWELLSYYKRALRLGHLSVWDGEYEFCAYYLELAGDCLMSGYVHAFITCMQRVANRVELSHSKGGWFRKLGKTQKHEYTEEVLDPKKNKPGLFGQKKQE